MSKLKSKKIKVFLKILICIVSVFFPLFNSFSLDLKLFNFLSNWVDKVEKNIEINEASWQPIIENLYTYSLEQVQYEILSPVLESLKQTTIALNDEFLCNITDKDLMNILYKSNDEFKNNLKGVSNSFEIPTKDDMVNSCSKLTSCVANKNASSKIVNALSYCKLIVNNYYMNTYRSRSNISSLDNGNKWSDAFWNKSLDDSSYDILYDIYLLAKIMFDEAEEPVDVLFYEMPVIRNSSTNNTPNVVVENDRFSPYNIIIQQTWWNSWENEWSLWGGWVWEGNASWEQMWVNWVIDDDFGMFVDETIVYEVDGSDWYSFLWSDCITWFEIQWYSWYIYTSTVSTYVSLYPDNPTEAANIIINDINNLSCNHNWICEDARESHTTCDDCLSSSWWVSYPDEMTEFFNNNTGFLSDPQVVRCFSSCGSTPCTATSCDRLACYAKCLCLSYESPFYDPMEHHWLDRVFKLKFCIVPVQDHKVVTTKKVYNLASIVNEINNVIQNLRNSGELMLNKKTREFLQAWFRNVKANSVSFSQDSYAKMPTSKPSEKQEMEDQINLNTSMMENILWFESTITNNWAWRNKYVVKWWRDLSWSLIFLEEQTGGYVEVDNDLLVSSLQTEYVSNVKNELSKFLEWNLNFWIAVKDSFDSLYVTANNLFEKRD